VDARQGYIEEDHRVVALEERGERRFTALDRLDVQVERLEQAVKHCELGSVVVDDQHSRESGTRGG